MAQENVLIVEDDELMRGILRQLLKNAGYEVFTADSAETAIEIFTDNEIDVTLTDLKMSGESGLALLDQIKSVDEAAIVIVLTAYSSVDTAVAALRKGAYDYISKPFINENLLQTVRNAADNRLLFRENRALRRELRRFQGSTEMVGNSDAIRQVTDRIRRVSSTSANVLICGESGTGKELVARSIHHSSSRADRPFLAINCGALPESLLESELFGHMKGSFTGATSDKRGLFRSVAGGTLFLDEVGDMPLSLQVKLLRAIQEHEVTPVGSSFAERFDARIVAATHRVLEDEVKTGRFREDLFYRLNVVEIEIPPLRQRRDDIPLLVKHFVRKAAAAQKMPEISVTKEALTELTNYDWPGNIRELENVIERAVVLSDNEITLESLPLKVCAARSDAFEDYGLISLETVEQRHVRKVLAHFDGDKPATAKVLGIDLSTLYRKLKSYEPDR